MVLRDIISDMEARLETCSRSPFLTWLALLIPMPTA
jgi:hypothetical protein